ncbi:hypothetical protein QZH41_008876 [Actinostola sp. cb2023]|nr:hypothetical protein QZH41_008876 [Actinostola sp. cb2023]
MLKMIVLPLIIASLITALSSLDSKSTGKIGRRTFSPKTSSQRVLCRFSPIGIFCLVCAKVAQMNNVLATLQTIGLFVLTVLSAITIHGIIVLPLLYFLMTRMNPFKFMVGMGDALATAFGISSSSATLPTTIRCAEQNKYNKVDSRIATFVLPLGATVNMDGSAVFEGVVGVFVAQINGIETTPAFLFTNILMALALSTGAGGIPSAGFIYPVILLQTLGLPVEDLALILPVEWFLDRFRTMLNVWGDAVGAGIVNHMSRDDLLELDAQMAENGEAGCHTQSPLTINIDGDDEDKKLPGQFVHETTF